MTTQLTAKWLGTITSLPQPSRQDVEFAPKTKDWHWQPVGMDISADNLAAVILTYRAVYYYQRQPGQDWLDALNTQPHARRHRQFQECRGRRVW